MSFQVDTAFVKQYHANVERLLQQKGSRLRGKTRMETQNSEEQFWEQIGAVEASEITTRHGDSPQVDTPHDRRRCTLRFYDIGDMIDTVDKVQMLIDPASTYVQNFADALNRKYDDTVIAAFTAAVATGKNGTSTAAFQSTASTSGGMRVDVDFGGNNTGLTIAKLIEARRVLLSRQNDPGDEPWYILVNAAGLADLLNTTQVTSADFNTVKALVKGEVNTFLGFEFVHSERILTTASDTETVMEFPFWTKSGMLAAMGKDITTEVARRADKRFSWYAYAMAGFGAIRMQEGKVGIIEKYISG
jgi:hypothetical protein